MTIKNYLEDINRRKRLITLHKERLGELESKMLYVAQRWGENTTGSNNPHSKENLIAMFMDEKQSLLEEISTLQEKESIAYRMVCSLSNPDVMDIFYKRYLENFKWEDIANELGITTQWVFELHKRGLKELEKRYPTI